jgi:glucose-6-phosphate 1-epimerase
MAETLEALNKRFGIAGVVKFDAGEGELTRVVVTSPSAEAHVYLHGAHVTHYQPRGGKPVLFVSKESAFADGKPIRGGVPVIFPWFGPHKSDASQPAHGAVRLHDWSVEGATRKGEEVELIFSTTTDTAVLRFTATIGKTLEMALEVRNTAAAEFNFEEALHTYFAVGDVRRISIHGLKGTDYKDKIQNFKIIHEDAEAIRFVGPTDRLYMRTTATCTVDDPGNRRTILVEKEHSDTTVVWNPGAQGAANMPDLGNDEWSSFVCVETANAQESAVTLAPGGIHVMRARVSLELA